MTLSDGAPGLPRAEARLPHWMLVLACAGTCGMMLFTDVRAGAGFALGSGLAILNYLWLHQVVEAVMSAGVSQPGKAVFAKLLVRYPLAFGVVFLFYRTRWLPFQAILAGLFVPLAAVLFESCLLVWSGLRNSS